MARARKEKQGELPFPKRGGKRPGAGRKPNGKRAGVKHLARAYSTEREPLHVGLRLCRGVPNMQWPRVFKVVQRVFEWVGPATLSACWNARGWPPEPEEPLRHAAGGVQIEYAGPCP